jgi:hypothetical protein
MPYFAHKIAIYPRINTLAAAASKALKKALSTYDRCERYSWQYYTGNCN